MCRSFVMCRTFVLVLAMLCIAIFQAAGQVWQSDPAQGSWQRASQGASAPIGRIAGASADTQGAAKAGATRLKDVKTVFIEPMANDLDHFLRAAISQKLARRITILLTPEQADAVLTAEGGCTEDDEAPMWSSFVYCPPSAVSLVASNRVLWAAAAGDRNWWSSGIGCPGPRRVAERLVDNFKKALQNAK
jgi:hypothetical protein